MADRDAGVLADDMLAQQRARGAIGQRDRAIGDQQHRLGDRVEDRREHWLGRGAGGGGGGVVIQPAGGEQHRRNPAAERQQRGLRITADRQRRHARDGDQRDAPARAPTELLPFAPHVPARYTSGRRATSIRLAGASAL